MSKPSRSQQAKTSTSSVQQTRKQPVAPPVYRPQPTPHVLQRKAAVKQSPVGQVKPATAAPQKTQRAMPFSLNRPQAAARSFPDQSYNQRVLQLRQQDAQKQSQSASVQLTRLQSSGTLKRQIMARGQTIQRAEQRFSSSGGSNNNNNNDDGASSSNPQSMPSSALIDAVTKAGNILHAIAGTANTDNEKRGMLLQQLLDLLRENPELKAVNSDNWAYGQTLGARIKEMHNASCHEAWAKTTLMLLMYYLKDHRQSIPPKWSERPK